MASLPTISIDERPETVEALSSVFCQRFRQEPEFLRSFLDQYMGKATQAKREVWDRAQRDPESIRNMAIDDLNKRSNSELLLTLIKNQDLLGSDELIFDPNARRQAVDEAARWCNGSQIAAIGIGMAVVLAMLIIPPCKYVSEDVDYFLEILPVSVNVAEQRFEGYRLASTALKVHEEYPAGGMIIFSRYHRKRTAVDSGILLVQIAIVAGIVATSIVRLRSPVPRIDAPKGANHGRKQEHE